MRRPQVANVTIEKIDDRHRFCYFMKKLAWHGWLGMFLAVVCWVLNWSLPGLRTHVFFFFQWVGYILAVDGLVLLRSGSSLLIRSRAKFAALFLFSAPAWWLFELINSRTQNWFYDGREHFTDLEYAVLATFAFSTVIPAVFETAELVTTFRWMKTRRSGPRVTTSRRAVTVMLMIGVASLVLLLVWPSYFFVFVWLSLYFILEPVNVWLKNGSLLDHTARKDWRPVYSLWIGGLVCGFFWEFWNYFAYPKWIYEIPFFDRLYVFEMPVAGYLGYLPFSLELYALYQMMAGLFRWKGAAEYVRVVPV